MPRRVFTEQAQLTGVEKALATLRRRKRTGGGGPLWLIPSLERRKQDLEKRLKRNEKPGRTASFLDRTIFGGGGSTNTNGRG